MCRGVALKRGAVIGRRSQRLETDTIVRRTNFSPGWRPSLGHKFCQRFHNRTSKTQNWSRKGASKSTFAALIIWRLAWQPPPRSQTHGTGAISANPLSLRLTNPWSSGVFAMILGPSHAARSRSSLRGGALCGEHPRPRAFSQRGNGSGNCSAGLIQKAPHYRGYSFVIAVYLLIFTQK